MTTTQARPDQRSMRIRKKTRFSLLDGLRFAAAAGVVMFHFTSKQQEAWGGRSVPEIFPHLHTFTALGYYGVHLFFVISGFVILMTAWGKDLPSYVSSRVARLYPAYVVAVLAVSILLGVIWLGQKDLTAYQIAVNLTMFQGAFNINHIDGVYWTLWVELRFYVLIAILMMIGLNRQRILAFALLWPVAGALARSTDQQFFVEALDAEYAPLFAGGMAIYLLSRNRNDFAAWVVLASAALLAVAVPGQHSQAKLENATGVGFSGHTTAVVILGCFALVAVATLTPLRSVQAKWLTVAGLLTYPLYLMHEWWGWWMIHLLSGRVPDVVVLMITLVFVCALAALVHYLVERPFGPRVRATVDRSLRATFPHK